MKAQQLFLPHGEGQNMNIWKMIKIPKKPIMYQRFFEFLSKNRQPIRVVDLQTGFEDSEEAFLVYTNCTHKKAQELIDYLNH